MNWISPLAFHRFSGGSVFGLSFHASARMPDSLIMTDIMWRGTQTASGAESPAHTSSSLGKKPSPMSLVATMFIGKPPLQRTCAR